MKEIEVKILEINRKQCEEILEQLGAQKIFEEDMITYAFDFQNSELKNKNQILRLRKESNSQVLGFKEMISQAEAKEMIEIETEVSSFESTKLLLEKIGFQIWAKTNKTRISYKIDNTRFDFDKYHDKYEFIPEFLEIESDNFETIKEFSSKLGFQEKDLKSWTFKDLLQKYQRN